eukprot:Awhi_evm2s2575
MNNSSLIVNARPTNALINTASSPIYADLENEIKGTLQGEALRADLPYSLISPKQLDDAGSYTLFGDGKVTILSQDPQPHPDSIIIQGTLQSNNLYTLPHLPTNQTQTSICHSNIAQHTTLSTGHDKINYTMTTATYPINIYEQSIRTLNHSHTTTVPLV